MRGNWNHDEPRITQECPADNTSKYCRRQVREWKLTDTLIHPEIAMEVAAWYHGPKWPALMAFSHSGTITDDLLPELEKTFNDPEYGTDDLNALIAYVRTVKGKAPETELLIEVIWNPQQRSWCVKARANSQSEWNYFDGDESELDDLLSIASDVATGGE